MTAASDLEWFCALRGMSCLCHGMDLTLAPALQFDVEKVASLFSCP